MSRSNCGICRCKGLLTCACLNSTQSELAERYRKDITKPQLSLFDSLPGLKRIIEGGVHSRDFNPSPTITQPEAVKYTDANNGATEDGKTTTS